jgi:hypothetical protein
VTFTQLWNEIFSVTPADKPMQSCAGADCHNPGKKDGLDFSTKALAYATLTKQPGTKVPAVLPGKPDTSKLILRFLDKDLKRRMPLAPVGMTRPPLPADLIAKARAWILAGAKND